MWNSNLCLVLCCALLTPSLAIWQCASDDDCTSLSGSVCASGRCACAGTQQVVAAGTRCSEYAPYYTSSCVEDFQCSRLFTAFQCRHHEGDTAGSCFCQPNHHFFHGRCWPSVELEQPCSHDEECMGTIRDPYSMTCDGTCQCADGYYNRQRGECRRIGAAVGDRCVLDEDCQFTNSACHHRDFICFDTSVETLTDNTAVNTRNTSFKMASATTRQHGVACSATSTCPAPFECSAWGQCVCPLGYYGSQDDSTCLAELGSPSTEAQCVGLFAVVEGGICTCPANFFFHENMRDCVKAERCFCQPNHHFFHGRCWPSVELGQPCSRDEECMGTIRDPYSMTCNGTCQCADGYYNRQRGECRRIGADSTSVNTRNTSFKMASATTRQHGVACSATSTCPAPFECSAWGQCVCPLGYYGSQDDSTCLAELGSPSTEAQCVGLFAVVEGGICTCPANFFFHENMRDCVKAERCFCQPNHHFFHGRCWPSVELEQPCSHDEECMGTIRDPYSMTCNGTCQCADGYYNRQRGECRRIGAAVGDRCVLDEDCQFTNSACHHRDFICFDTSVETLTDNTAVNTRNTSFKMASATTRQHGVACSATSACPAPFECTAWGQCVCPLGYYGSQDDSTCLAELGSPSTEAQCAGLLAVIEGGICTCPANFFFDENMRDCVKVARYITDFCLFDEQCHTFGAMSFCGAEGQWGLRTCECDLEHAVWDAQRSMCRLFAGIGEPCEVDSDCMAGELEIQCALDDEGEGYCACPDGLNASGGLCLSEGLELGDSCQVTAECTGTPNTVCATGRCTCDNGYQEVGDFCAPTLGGTCAVDTDCAINNTACVERDSGSTCQCLEDYVEYSDECWLDCPEQGCCGCSFFDIRGCECGYKKAHIRGWVCGCGLSSGYNATCAVDFQCAASLGSSAACLNGFCLCGSNFHYRDGACWPETGLFEACSYHSQCYLGDLTDRVVCRNGLCQCAFYHPYSEELGTCTSSATTVTSSIFVVITTFFYLL